MSSGCLSDLESNGCIGCGMGLALMEISSYATEPADPENPECPVFLGIQKKHQSRATFMSTWDPYSGPSGDQGGANVSSNYEAFTIIKETEDLVIEIYTVNGFSTSNSNISSYGPSPLDKGFSKYSMVSTIGGTIITKTDSCGNIEVENNVIASTSVQTSCLSEWGVGFSCCEDDQDVPCSNSSSERSDTFIFDETTYTGASCCESYTSSNSSSCEGSISIGEGGCTGCSINPCYEVCEEAPATISTSYSTTITNTHPVTPKAPLGRDALISRDLGRKRTNKYVCKPAPKNCCKCGGEQGDKDSCWGGFVGFSIPDESDQGKPRRKAELRIMADQKIFDKKYKSISGNVIFYIPSESEPGTTPCCMECGGPECFTGTVVDTMSFSISAGSTAVYGGNTYYYRPIGDLDSSGYQTYKDETLSACITIDNISFI